MKILITGSEGNIGKKLVSHLKEHGHDVFRVDIKQGFGDDFTVADINNVSDMLPVFMQFRPDVVYHLAAMVSRITCEKSPSITIATNISGTNNIIQLCKQFNCKLINFSTSEIYGNIGGLLSEDRTDIAPNNLYGLSKYLAESLVEYEVKNNGLKAITVRPFMIYDEEETNGVHRSAMIRFAENLSRRKKIEVHKGSSRSWMHIKDAVTVLKKLLYCNEYIVMNMGNPESVKTEDLAALMCDELGIDYNEYVIETELPGKMTLDKQPDLSIQYSIAGKEYNYGVTRGARLVLNSMAIKIKNER
jgi:nucleoside-diphosphate-sugar epimerase